MFYHWLSLLSVTIVYRQYMSTYEKLILYFYKDIRKEWDFVEYYHCDLKWNFNYKWENEANNNLTV